MNDTSDYEHCVFCSLESSNKAHDASSKLDELNEKVTAHFKKVCPLSSFYLYEQSSGHYVASILFKKDKDLKSFEKTGLSQKLTDYVHAELENAAIGKRGQFSVHFYFEASENMESIGRAPNIPTDEDLARADRLDRERSRNLDKVCDAVKRHFTALCPLHNVYILWQQDVDFRAYIFFEKDKDINACKDNGVIRNMIDLVYDELERAGRGKRGEITIGFEFDSDENVVANYEGDYLLRLR